MFDNTELMDHIERLIKIMRDHDTKSVHVETETWKIDIKQDHVHKEELVSNGGIPQKEEEVSSNSETTPNNVVVAPLVGIFYRAPSPQSEVYAELGDTVEPGQVLCIIEAMKVMNEIHADRYGQIKKIFVENSEMVEYGQPLFEITPKEKGNDS